MTDGLRCLPVTVAPLHHETLGSYLNRLAEANRLTVTTLSSVIVGRSWRWRRDSDNAKHWTPEALDRLAVSTGRSADALVRALPALREARHPTVIRIPLAVIELAAQPRMRAACRACAARHGVHGLVIRRLESHDIICRRHHRWLADAHQHPLDGLPQIETANRRHRRLAHHHGTTASEVAYRAASHHLQQRFNQPGYDELQQRWNLHLGQLSEDPYADPYKPSTDQIELITYPETVALTIWLAQNPAHDFRGTSSSPPARGRLTRDLALLM
jgi:hypothetical protein